MKQAENGEDYLVIVYDAGNTYVYKTVEGNNTSLDAAKMLLMGVVEGFGVDTYLTADNI